VLLRKSVTLMERSWQSAELRVSSFVLLERHGCHLTIELSGGGRIPHENSADRHSRPLERIVSPIAAGASEALRSPRTR
jgi:hypothetical protein